MPARKPITNFSRGEFGPQLYGRVDIPQYEAGAKHLTNFIVQRYGGAAFRPGFRYVATIQDDISERLSLIPFQYSIEQSYVLVMSDTAMNVAADGGLVVEEDLKIVSATFGPATTLEIPYHGYGVGERLELHSNVGPLELNGRIVVITAIPDGNHVTIDLDSTGYPALTSSSGIIRTAVPTAPTASEPPLPAPPPPPEPALTSGDNTEEPIQGFADLGTGETFDVGGRGYWSKTGVL